jgi:hypothetical protein
MDTQDSEYVQKHDVSDNEETKSDVETESEAESDDSNSEGVQSESSDEYERAICKYAELLNDIPHYKRSGIVEIIEDILTGKIEMNGDHLYAVQDNNNNNDIDNILFAIFMTGIVVLISTILGMTLGTKTNFANLI